MWFRHRKKDDLGDYEMYKKQIASQDRAGKKMPPEEVEDVDDVEDVPDEDSFDKMFPPNNGMGGASFFGFDFGKLRVPI